MFPFDLQELDQVRSLETLSRRQRLWLLAGRKCHWCGCDTVLTTTQCKNQATIDHIVPRYKGGTNAESNLVSACFSCNQRRNKEDQCGHPEGHLLGKFVAGTATRAAVKPRPIAHHATHLEQRDQALARIRVLEGELRRCCQQRDEAERQLRTMTLRRLVLLKLTRWLEKDV